LSYSVEILPSAERELGRLPVKDRKRVDRHILALAAEPRPKGNKTLKGQKGLYRLRVGNYRVVYQVRDDVFTVLIVKVGHRRDVYRNL
jgi:mRNA interferase RelE/StbE